VFIRKGGLTMAGRVMIFIDGGNFEGSCRSIDEHLTHEIDFNKLSSALVKYSNGDSYQGTYFYCSYRPKMAGLSAEEIEKINKKVKFYDALQFKTGYTVRKFRRKIRSETCVQCGKTTTFTIEKGVDSNLVADLLTLAWEDAFDIAVVLSDDADIGAAIDYLKRKGKKVFHASFSKLQHGQEIRKLCFGLIDLTSVYELSGRMWAEVQ
jgi:uncharacterized LabA/DUF88 family protein